MANMGVGQGITDPSKRVKLPHAKRPKITSKTKSTKRKSLDPIKTQKAEDTLKTQLFKEPKEKLAERTTRRKPPRPSKEDRPSIETLTATRIGKGTVKTALKAIRQFIQFIFKPATAAIKALKKLASGTDVAKNVKEASLKSAPALETSQKPVTPDTLPVWERGGGVVTMGNKKYDMIEKSGSGAFATIFKVERDNKIYAMKIFDRPALEGEPTNDDYREILNEINLHHAIDGGPGIPKIHETFIDQNGKIYMVMDYVENYKGLKLLTMADRSNQEKCRVVNNQLKQHLNEFENPIHQDKLNAIIDYVNKAKDAPDTEGDTVLSAEIFSAFAIQIGKTMSHLGQNQVVHRDINPNNFLISFGKFPTDKIKEILDALPSDFGQKKAEMHSIIHKIATEIMKNMTVSICDFGDSIMFNDDKFPTGINVQNKDQPAGKETYNAPDNDRANPAFRERFTALIHSNVWEKSRYGKLDREDVKSFHVIEKTENDFSSLRSNDQNSLAQTFLYFITGKNAYSDARRQSPRSENDIRSPIDNYLFAKKWIPDNYPNKEAIIKSMHPNADQRGPMETLFRDIKARQTI